MKKKILAVWLGAVMLLTLAGCGGSGNSSAIANYKMEEAMETTTASSTSASYGGGVVYEAAELEFADVTAPGTAETGSAVTQKLICTAYLEMETTEFDTAISALTELTEEYGGYFESTSVRKRGSGYRSAEYIIRVPAERYQAFLNQAGELCHETWRNTSQEDVTEYYYDTEGRLKTQKIKLERLQDLLTRAEDMEDIITIESAISETEQQIENLSGTLRHYDALVNYATITITLSEVYKLSNVEEVPDSFASRMSGAFADGLRSFWDNLEELAVSFAYSWMWWLLLVVVVVVVVRVVRKRKPKFPKMKKKKADDKADET